jgi:hypothetical protein
MVLFGAASGADAFVHDHTAIRTEAHGHHRTSVIVVGATRTRHSFVLFAAFGLETVLAG